MDKEDESLGPRNNQRSQINDNKNQPQKNDLSHSCCVNPLTLLEDSKPIAMNKEEQSRSEEMKKTKNNYYRKQRIITM